MKLWDKDAERGVILGAIASIIFFVFIHPDPDVDLAVKYPGNPPYGRVWFLLNPFYWTKELYPVIVFTEWAIMTLVQYWLIRKGILRKNVLLLQIFSVMFLFMIHAEQDVTVIMFAPFASLTPWAVLWEILLKIPFPGTDQWTCAFNGGGLATNAYQNPCLTTGTKFFIFSPHVYSLTYILLVFWAVYPLLIWSKSSKVCKSMRRMLLSSGGQNRKQKLQKILSWGLWKGEGVEESSLADPHKRKQPSTPLPTKKLSRLDILLLLALGISAHDVASIYGFHIPGLHAIYFSIPMILLILSMKVKRRIWKK